MATSPILDEIKTKDPTHLVPNYSDDEIAYISGLQQRLEDAYTQRESPHDEFDGMTYTEYWQENEKGANTQIPPKKNKSDVTFASGTIEQKLTTILSHVNNLDLNPNLTALDTNDLEIVSIGNALEIVIQKTNQLDDDDEKKLLRQHTLLKQGVYFAEEVFEERWGWIKKLKKPFDGKISSAIWDKVYKKLLCKCTRNSICGLNVFLGDITQYYINKQPYVFTAKYPTYDDAKEKYGKWERWKYVSKNLKSFDESKFNNSILYNTWRLVNNIKDNRVEEIIYTDKYNREYAVILNGVLMTPIGLPFPWGYEDYNITQQNLQPIHENFAYGKSLVFKFKNNVALYDELLKLALLMTQKQYRPPYLNLSGKVVSPYMFMPGVVTQGFQAGDLVPISDQEVKGVQTGEIAMINQIKQVIDGLSVSNQFQGQASPESQTATETIILQRQAKQTLGIIIFAMSMMEYKLNWLRLFNILENWFEPVDKIVDRARNMLINKYRVASVRGPIEGKGIGRKLVIPTDEEITPQAIYDTEERLEKENGYPIRITAINPKVFFDAKITWQMVVTPTEKKSDELSKVLFRGFMNDIAVFGQDINFDYLEEEFAAVWDKDPSKLFKKQATPMIPQQTGSQKIPGMPNPEQAVSDVLSNQMKI